MNISCVEKSLCNGCMVCMQSCPKSCIVAKYDKEGFLYPKNMGGCVDCGKCISVCPAITPGWFNDIIEAYAVAPKTPERTVRSSSAGVFFEMAQYFITQLHGYVCGCVINEDLTVAHILTDEIENVKRMQGSKYIQSNIAACLKPIKEACANGKYVLFAGTPCQVAAIRSYVDVCDTLYTMDLICHGVASPLAFKSYIECEYSGMKFDSFRYKNPYQITSFALSFVQNNSSIRRIHAHKDPFYNSYLLGYSYRESCYHCQYAKEKRCGNMTIGDCANLHAYPSLRGKPISSVFVNDDKGKFLWRILKQYMEYEIADLRKEIMLNHQLHAPVKRPEIRDRFYADLHENNQRQFRLKYAEPFSFQRNIKHFLIMHIPFRMREKMKFPARYILKLFKKAPS